MGRQNYQVEIAAVPLWLISAREGDKSGIAYGGIKPVDE